MKRSNDEPNRTIPIRAARGARFKLAALTLTLISALAGTGLAYWLKPPVPETPAKSEDKSDPFARLFPKWSKPDFVLILSAQQHGYMLPCGCSHPQVGGLERRYNFLELLKEHGWAFVPVDLGDVAQRSGPTKGLPNVQGLLKYQYSMRALGRMGYLGVGIGEYETANSLGAIEGAWAANNDTPAVLLGNLADPDSFPLLKSMAARTVAGVRVGVTNIIGRTVAKQIKDTNLKLKNSAAALNQQLAAMQADKVNLPILLYHGSATPSKDGIKEAMLCAEKYPQFPVIVCLSEEDEPPAGPIEVKNPQTGQRSFIFRLGHKGKNIGVLGVYRNPAGNPPFTFKYKLVEMSEDYLTPKAQEAGHPIIDMMEEYTRQLKKDNYLARYGQSQHTLQAMPPVAGIAGVPTYVGSEKCKGCHRDAFKKWKDTPHSHAYQTLVDARHPSLRQYDGECIVCHTVGFGYNSGFASEGKTPTLINVGCESCHGPGSLHVQNSQDEEWQKRMNQPWRNAKNENAKKLAIDRFCQGCHDIDNDVTWINNAFPKKWAKIIHGKDKD